MFATTIQRESYRSSDRAIPTMASGFVSGKRLWL